MNHRVQVLSTMWRIKNQSSTVTPLLVVIMPHTCWFLLRVEYVEDYQWCLHFQFGIPFWRVVLREVYILKGQIMFEGHWRLQSWTLIGSQVPSCVQVWSMHMHFNVKGFSIITLHQKTAWYWPFHKLCNHNVKPFTRETDESNQQLAWMRGASRLILTNILNVNVKMRQVS